jgi:dipeptidyl-peptidase-3
MHILKAGGKEVAEILQTTKKLVLSGKMERWEKLHTLHEVVGHTSGQINAGVGTPKKLESYASTLKKEELI